MVPYFDEPGVRFDDPLVHYDDPRTYQQILNAQKGKAMFEVVLDISNLSIEALIARAREIKAGIASQAAFSSLAAKLGQLETAADTLEARELSIAAAKGLVSQNVSLRDEAKPAVTDLLGELAGDVGKLAPDEATVAATTLRIKSKPAPKPVPDRPAGLELAGGDEDGEISGQCSGQPGIVEYYEIRWTTGDPAAPATVWNPGETSKKSVFEIKNLPTGQKAWVQLRAVNARGKSAWSDPACVRVP